MRKRDCTTNGYKSTTEHSHLWCFQFTVAWEENAMHGKRMQYVLFMVIWQEEFIEIDNHERIRTKVCFPLLKLSLLCLRGVLERFAEKHQSSNVALMFQSNLPKFELLYIYIYIYITFLSIYSKRLTHVEGRQLILHCVSVDWFLYECKLRSSWICLM